MKLNLKKQQNTMSPEEVIVQNRQKTAQQWMPIKDVNRSIVYRKDGLLIGILRVYPINLELLSDNEKKRKIDSLTEELNGEREGFQIFCIGRPVDLNSYLEWLLEKAKMEQNFTRKNVLKGYIQQASEMASSGETVERRFYIIITKDSKVHRAEEELINRLNEFNMKLAAAELSSEICQDDEIMDLYSLFANPAQAAFEKSTKDLHVSTLLKI